MTTTELPASVWAKRINRGTDRLLRVLAHHWLAGANILLVTYLALATAAPLLMAAGFQRTASAIYLVFRPICHQIPSHSHFISGYQMACCQRCAAIYGAMLVGGFLFLLVRNRLPRLQFKQFVVLCVPMAIDGLSQLLGFRESTWELRSLTGGLFGLAAVWLIYPIFEKTMGELAELLAGTRYTGNGFAPAGTPVLREG